MPHSRIHLHRSFVCVPMSRPFIRPSVALITALSTHFDWTGRVRAAWLSDSQCRQCAVGS